MRCDAICGRCSAHWVRGELHSFWQGRSTDFQLDAIVAILGGTTACQRRFELPVVLLHQPGLLALTAVQQPVEARGEVLLARLSLDLPDGYSVLIEDQRCGHQYSEAKFLQSFLRCSRPH